MATKLKPYITPEPYSGTFSAGTFDIYPASGLNHNPYNTTVGTPMPYMYPIAYTTESIGSSKDQTVYISILYYIPDINNTDIDINRGAMYYQLENGPAIPNAIIELYQDPVTASGYPLSATPYSISSIGAPYETTHSSGTYMCSNNESLILALVNTNPASIQNFKLTDANVVSMISAPLYPGQSNIARTTITPTDEDIWAVLVYRADLVWALSYKAIMFRDFKVLKYKSVTLISDKGVLIFNNPDQYVKFSSESNDDENSIQQHSIISVDTLKAHTIYADNIISDYNTPKGGDSPTGGGILGLLYDDNSTITSQHTISAPAFSGVGFHLPDNYTPTTAFGHYPAGTQLLQGKNLLLAILSAFMYQSPYISLVGSAPSITWGNATDPFITTAMNATKTWGDQYLLPAKFATTTVSVTYSGVQWNYNHPDNIDWSTIEGAYLSSSVTHAAGIVLAHTDLSKTYFSSSAGLAYSRDPVSYSVKFAKDDSVLSSKEQWAKLTPNLGWSGVKDTLNIAIAAPGLIANTSTKTTNNLGRYGSRFLLVRQKSTNDGVLWKACNSDGTITPIVGDWGSYALAFTNSVPFLGAATAIQKTLTMHSTLYDGTNGSHPISLVLLAPSSCVIYSIQNSRGLWSLGPARLNCSTFASATGNGVMSYNDVSAAAYNLSGITEEEGSDPYSAFNSSATGFTKTWPVGLSSTMKLFIIRTLTNETTANWTMTWNAN